MRIYNDKSTSYYDNIVSLLAYTSIISSFLIKFWKNIWNIWQMFSSYFVNWTSRWNRSKRFWVISSSFCSNKKSTILSLSRSKKNWKSYLSFNFQSHWNNWKRIWISQIECEITSRIILNCQTRFKFAKLWYSKIFRLKIILANVLATMLVWIYLSCQKLSYIKLFKIFFSNRRFSCITIELVNYMSTWMSHTNATLTSSFFISKMTKKFLSKTI